MLWPETPTPWRMTGCLLLTACLAGCQQPPLVQQERYVFGTRVQISIWGLPEALSRQEMDRVLGEMERLHRKLHAWQTSDLTRLNTAFSIGEAATIDIELRGLLQEAARYETISDELFCPAIGMLVAEWGFHQDQPKPANPDPHVITSVVTAKPRLSDLDISDTTVSSRNPTVQLDLGGMAKGFALDHAAAMLQKHRINNALINIGGHVLALGKKGNEAWKVGIQDTRRPEAMAVVELQDGEAIGTSGDYQRYFEKDGQRYSHLIDPRSGRPAQGIRAVTVIAPKGLRAGTVSDVATKPMFIGGLDTARDYANRFGIRDALLVSNDGSVYITPSLQPRLKWLLPPRHLYWLR
ncbi:FAD:protein FMN transferase [Parachitinimonas caeni]|uniref:FAD:protein FMN transferase n=1 Tax=Parachitinimonas caeni TaxID=3031301 RepID=A0ABT7DR64_9NEIS|nr:FAD:protein FMN transferase [Parachitinimonas caeni]MDK2122563.1 FAD:protein FMN transferase [Parachitinimonas caeni]